MLGRGFIIFCIFLLFFSEFSCPGRVWTEFATKMFFLFFSLSHPVLSIKKAGKRFFNFWFFFYFFRNFFARVEYEQNLGLNSFSLFLGLSHPVLAKNNAGKRFFNFFNFFAIFFGIFLPGSSTNGIWEKKIFHSFSTYLIPF